MSLEDIIEEIVGEISDESDAVESAYTKLDDRNYLFDGKTHIGDFERILQLPENTFADVKGEAETLAGLKERGVRVALASSSPLNNIEEVLGTCGIREYFEFLVSGEQFKRSKPDPDIYLHAIDRLGLPADRCCCVEDSLYGITAGKRAGLTVIAKREERFGFSQDAADKIIDQLPELLTLS